MQIRYKNPWCGASYGPEYWESDTLIEEMGDCKMYLRYEYSVPVYDVVSDGLCVAQCPSLSMARRDVNERGWTKFDWWKNRRGNEKAENQG